MLGELQKEALDWNRGGQHLSAQTAWILSRRGDHIPGWFVAIRCSGDISHGLLQDLLMRTVPDNYKLNPGAVEALLERPGELNDQLWIKLCWRRFQKISQIESGIPFKKV